MATNFPGSLDSFTNPSASDAMDSVTVPHADQHANLNDAMEAVQAKLGTGAGTIGEWSTWTPSFYFGGTNVSATIQYAQYAEINGVVHAVGRAQLTSTASGNLNFTLPVSHDTGTYYIMGNGSLYDVSTGNGYTPAVLNYQPTANRACMVVQTTDLVTSTNPFTFATSDLIQFYVTYKAA